MTTETVLFVCFFRAKGVKEKGKRDSRHTLPLTDYSLIRMSVERVVYLESEEDKKKKHGAVVVVGNTSSQVPMETGKKKQAVPANFFTERRGLISWVRIEREGREG